MMIASASFDFAELLSHQTRCDSVLSFFKPFYHDVINWKKGSSRCSQFFIKVIAILYAFCGGGKDLLEREKAFEPTSHNHV